jgi:hypothetical protein
LCVIEIILRKENLPMKDKSIKSINPKRDTRINPKTTIQLEKEYLDLKIQENKLHGKMLKNRRDLLELRSTDKNGKGFFAECDFKDFPDNED